MIPGAQDHGKRKRNIHFAITIFVLAALLPATLPISPLAVLTIILLMLTILNYWISKDVLYPGFLFCLIWLSAASGYLLYPGEINPLGWRAAGTFIAGAMFLSIGCILGNRPLFRRSIPDFHAIRSTSATFGLLLLAYVAIICPFFFLDTVRLAGGFEWSPLFFIRARDAIVEVHRASDTPAYSNRILSTAPMTAILATWILMLGNHSRLTKVTCTAIALFMSILTTGRTGLLQLLCGCAVIILLRMRDRSFTAMRRTIALLAGGTLVLLTCITLLTKRETQGNDMMAAASTMTMSYIAGPLAAFDFGIHHFEQSQHLDSFVSVPFYTNVYTAYRTYYLLLGNLCSVPFLLFGAVHGFLYNGAVRGRKIAQFLMAYLYYALILSPFADAYGLALRHVEVMGIAIACFIIAPKFSRLLHPSRPVGAQSTVSA
jgi:oligosaccharide repeat unit polymerase